MPSTANRRERAARWLCSSGLHLETILAVVVLLAAIVTAVVVAFGAITALPTGAPPEGQPPQEQPGSLLSIGTTLLNGTILLALALGAIVLAHGIAELSIARRDEQSLRDRPVSYLAMRTIQTLAAFGFVGPIGVGYFLSRIGVIPNDVPSGVLWSLLAIAIVMLASILAHAVARGVRAIAS
ncbi:hypothetical protein [Halalkalirubrum salinum]|uniref:hypothetical protein n=1 Tax=Halalkalirubrum salinum TaxID=2563889 RepID=UPI0010FAE1EA|nr:hypothetical protein [Halalkalirubrum salinum]